MCEVCKRCWVLQHLCGSIQLFLLLLKDLVIIFVLLELFLAAVQQQFAEIHSGSRFVRGGHFQLDDRRKDRLKTTPLCA